MRSIAQQYDAESAIGPGYPHRTFDAYVEFVAFHPWLFHVDSALPHEARALFATSHTPPSRWALTDKTTPSGKSLVRCSRCGAETPNPTPVCRPSSAPGRAPGCSDALAAWGWHA